MDTKHKQTEIERLIIEIENLKKLALKNPGYVDDQSQTLEEHISELEGYRNKLLTSAKYDDNITDLKMKLKIIMQRKNQKTMEFFCNTQSIFIKYFDSLTKISQSKVFFLKY